MDENWPLDSPVTNNARINDYFLFLNLDRKSQNQSDKNDAKCFKFHFDFLLWTFVGYQTGQYYNDIQKNFQGRANTSQNDGLVD